MYTSDSIKRPNGNNYNEFFDHINSKNTYFLYGGEKEKKRFVKDNIYLSFETNAESTIKVIIGYANDSLFFPNISQKKQNNQINQEDSQDLFRNKYLTNVHFFQISSDQIEDLFKTKNSQTSKNDNEINYKSKKFSKEIVQKNMDVRRSYKEFLNLRNNNFLKYETRVKTAKIKNRFHQENNILQKTLQMHKWEMLKLQVF